MSENRELAAQLPGAEVGSPMGAALPASIPPPPEFPPPVKATLAWLQARFRAWYAAHPPPPPERFPRREFGFIPWPERPGPPPFHRHKAFSSADGPARYLAIHGPHSAYYSTAYYRRPSEMKMADKGWLGAELIFDLDADHLAEAEAAKKAGHEMPLADQLALVKGQFKRLLDDFLLGDFGLGPQDVWITFSGGRGYHAHVTHERFLRLDARARREVVDYVTGKFPVRPDGTMDFYPHIRRKGTDGVGGRFAKGFFSVEVATSKAPGWGGRLTRPVVDLLDQHVLGVPRTAAVKWLRQLPHVGPKTAEKFVHKYTGEVRARLMGERPHSGNSRAWSEGKDPGFHVLLSAEHNVLEKVFTLANQNLGLPFAKGETDEPVTADTKRLIRLPGSLHGKSGLQVVTLTRDELDAFDPLRDAVAFGADPVRFLARNDVEATLGGERVAVRKGEATEVPERHAVFWCARQQGIIVPPA